MLPHCYKNKEAVKPFLQKAKENLPYLAYITIYCAYTEEDQMFKVVALTHLRNFFKKGKISKEIFEELISMLDTFRDPYQDFYERGGYRTWADTKTNILGGLSL
ncbi:hypothetical protein [Robertmurraya sp. FSL R5-0851]|uniref:hypothetical protein n=1 Tax=Robertmurraya sp. FSL R5-0851 TaxID=2921584 RepID=UPI0030FB28AF